MKTLVSISIMTFLLIQGIMAQNGWSFSHYDQNKPLLVEYKKEINKTVFLLNVDDTLSFIETGASTDSHGVYRRFQFIAMPSETVLSEEKLKSDVLQIMDYHVIDFWQQIRAIPGTRYIVVKEIDIAEGAPKIYDVCTFAFLDKKK